MTRSIVKYLKRLARKRREVSELKRGRWKKVLQQLNQNGQAVSLSQKLRLKKKVCGI